MKIIRLLCFVSLSLVLLTSCKSKKATPIQNETGAKEISVPFSSSDYATDQNYFRARSSGKSPDMAAAKKIAMNNAKSEMASNIQTMIKKVTDQYTNQRSVGKDQEYENKFEELTREVTNQSLANISVKGEKIFQEPNGGYTYWVAIEADKKEVFKTIDSKISSDKKLQLDYDKAKFQQIFDEEMKKFADQNK